MASKSPKRILITTGDTDGIGDEVTFKALNQLGPKANVQFFVFTKQRSGPKRPFLKKPFKELKAHSLRAARRLEFDPKTVVLIHTRQSPALWVQDAAKACLEGHFQAMVTAPLSKTTIIRSGLKDIGHTEILARVTNSQDLFMGFIGDQFNVLLATGHKPLKAAVKSFTPAQLKKALLAARVLRSCLPTARRRLPIALVGLNPHAGERGLIGREESWMAKFAVKDVHGPLVPDAAFLKKYWNTYSVYLCPYHDQGLIPFKLVHGFKGGVHLTLGLPFVRTSVDHGTAKELYGKNLAESGSMKDALVTAIRLIKEP